MRRVHQRGIDKAPTAARQASIDHHSFDCESVAGASSAGSTATQASPAGNIQSPKTLLLGTALRTSI